MPIPKLPSLLDRKIYKTGQTRGADDDQIFQNRVGRNSTVLIPFSQFDSYKSMLDEGFLFENGYIVLVSPADYFAPGFIDQLTDKGLTIGQNTLLFYETRAQWINYNPADHQFIPASSRTNPLGGHYVARVAATTSSDNGGKINEGFTTTSLKGAGIRVYEYAPLVTIKECRLQLEAVYWMCLDSESVAIANSMTPEDIAARKTWVLAECEQKGLLNKQLLVENRIINSSGNATCPLCLEEISAAGFFNRTEQALGREVHDLTTTQLSLFHIKELRVGVFNHCTYNLGWGHHHCNVVTKDSGIAETLSWMREVLDRNYKAAV